MKNAILYLTTWLILGLFVLLILVSSLKESVIILPGKLKETINIFFPEGWSFFTRSPREEMAEIYEIKNNNTLTRISYQCSAPENLFGISKKSRKIGMELSIIATVINDSLWVNQGSSQINIDALPITKIKINQDDIKIILKGNYIIKTKMPIPWAWSNNVYTKPKIRMVRIELI